MSIGRRRFRIIKEIAEGGFGKVYLAEQISSDGFSRIVAVKLLHAKWSSHDEVVMRTRDEARLLGLVRHQHIVKVEDLTSIDGKCAIVMEYLEGVDLKAMIQFFKDRGTVFPRAALFEIILAVAGALDAAFNGTPLQGGDPLQVIHRDIKPSNIFATTAGGVKVLDFGTARANFAEREAKTQALAFGSQGYMAPERMLGEEDTPAADIFSLGITLYELLTLESFGRIPPRPNKFLKKVEERVASIPLEGDPDWCDQVRDTLRLMMSYDASERPSAPQLVEIMELLASDAGDMGLRRFCRTLVSEAQAAMPDLDTGDPLAGTVVDEDVSTGSTAHAVAPPPEASDPGAPPPDPPKNLGDTVDPAAADATDTAGSPSMSGTFTVGSSSGSIGAPVAPTPVEARRRAMLMAAAGSLLVLVVAGIIVLMFGLGTVVVIGSTGDDDDDESLVDEPPPPVPGGPGGRIVSAGDQTGDRVRTVLRYNDPRGGEVEIVGPDGFQAEWDGMATFDLGSIASGLYKVTVMTADDKKLRLRNFRVDADASTCRYLFDVAAEVWTGGCE